MTMNLLSVCNPAYADDALNPHASLLRPPVREALAKVPPGRQQQASEDIIGVKNSFSSCLELTNSILTYIMTANNVIMSVYMQSPSTPQRGLGGSERRILAHLAALEKPVITAADLGIVVEGREAANLILSRLARKGWLLRLRRGAYSVVSLSSASLTPSLEDPLAAAMRLFPPCYISGWTAAQQWDLTEQVFNSIAVYSARPQRRSSQTVGGLNFQARR